MGQGKGITSYRKQDTDWQKSSILGFKNLVFAHQATTDDTEIDLSNLSLPSEYSQVGFVNPSAQELAEAKLLFYKNNLLLFRSVAGAMMPYSAFRVTTNTKIVLDAEAQENEVFYGMIISSPRGNTYSVDGRKIVNTGVLVAGETEIYTSLPFETNSNPSERIGEVKVILDSAPLLRNTGNVSGTPDGGYYEVANSGADGNIVKVNSAELFDREYIVISTVMTALRPEGSRDAIVETLASQIDIMIPTLAALAGVDESDFQSGPNDVDLRQFGETVSDLKKLKPTVEAVSANKDLTVLDLGKVFLVSGDIDIKLPDPAESLGHSVRFKRNDSVNDFDILQYDSEDIEGLAAKYTVTNDKEYTEFVPDTDGNWWRIG